MSRAENRHQPQLVVEMTLAAALRDIEHRKARVRHLALRNLAPALLHAIGATGPKFGAHRDHSDGPTVVSALWRSCKADREGETSHDRGLALLGLARIGDTNVLDACLTVLQSTAEHEIAVFERECAIIALGELGMILPDDPQWRPMRKRLETELWTRIGDERTEVRYQIPRSLAQLNARDWQAALGQRLDVETNERVTSQILEVFAEHGRLDRSIILQIETFVRREDPNLLPEAWLHAGISFALGKSTLASACFTQALRFSETRQRALEAVAIMMTPAEPELLKMLRPIAEIRLWPSLENVRAAYALARVQPEQGRAVLAHYRRSFRPVIRQAARNAERQLDELQNRQES